MKIDRYFKFFGDIPIREDKIPLTKDGDFAVGLFFEGKPSIGLRVIADDSGEFVYKAFLESFMENVKDYQWVMVDGIVLYEKDANIIVDFNLDKTYIGVTLSITAQSDLDKLNEISEACKAAHQAAKDAYSGDGKIFMVTTNEYGSNIFENFDINVSEVPLELNYNDDFLKDRHQTIVKTLQEEKKGMVLLHGKPGTGKTTYIKYLTAMVDKPFVFIPSYLCKNLDSPGFIRLMRTKKNSIFIIEDAEKILLSRKDSGSDGAMASSALNLTDGIMADVLDIQFIFTFNCGRQDIDAAFLRAGRLIAEVDFPDLTADKANALAAHLESDKTYSQRTLLTEVYNGVAKVEEDAKPIDELVL